MKRTSIWKHWLNNLTLGVFESEMEKADYYRDYRDDGTSPDCAFDVKNRLDELYIGTALMPVMLAGTWALSLFVAFPVAAIVGLGAYAAALFKREFIPPSDAKIEKEAKIIRQVYEETSQGQELIEKYVSAHSSEQFLDKHSGEVMMWSGQSKEKRKILDKKFLNSLMSESAPAPNLQTNSTVPNAITPDIVAQAKQQLSEPSPAASQSSSPMKAIVPTISR